MRSSRPNSTATPTSATAPCASATRMSSVADLVARWRLPGATERALAALLDLLATDPHAPTTVRAREEAVDVHLADSLVALALPAVREARAIADLGAGAGLPGLALAAALPEARVWEVESAGRRCDFLRRAVAAAGLDNVEVVHARAEAWEAGLGTCDLVVARAL